MSFKGECFLSGVFALQSFLVTPLKKFVPQWLKAEPAPAWRFCTTWMASYKGPILYWLFQTFLFLRFSWKIPGPQVKHLSIDPLQGIILPNENQVCTPLSVLCDSNSRRMQCFYPKSRHREVDFRRTLIRLENLRRHLVKGTVSRVTPV